MILSATGLAAQAHWQRLPQHFPGLKLDAFVMMPDHMHGVLVIGGNRVNHDANNHAIRTVGATHFGTNPLDNPIRYPQNASPLRSDNPIRYSQNASPQRSDNPIRYPQNASPRRSPTPPTGRPTRPNGPKPKSLGAIVGNYKSVSTRQINRLRKTKGIRVWQRDYHDRIIRSQAELERTRAYIAANPKSWGKPKSRNQ
ncbi:MAG: hypothetical protein AAFQ89_06850 [Cyanobacteria bacterium J06626_18]